MSVQGARRSRTCLCESKGHYRAAADLSPYRQSCAGPRLCCRSCIPDPSRHRKKAQGRRSRYFSGAGSDLTIPLISNEPVNIGEKRLLQHELGEFFHKRSQSSLLHGRNELIVQAALTEQRMCSPLGGAGFEMFIEAEGFAGSAEQRQEGHC